MSVVVVSWILVLLATFGAHHALDVVSETHALRTEVERHRIRACARSGIELAARRLEATPSQERSRLAHPGPADPLAAIHSLDEGRFMVGTVRGESGQEIWSPGIEGTGARLPVAAADSTSLSLLPGMSDTAITTLLDARRTAGGRRIAPFDLLPLDGEARAGARVHLSRFGSAVDLNAAPERVLLAVGLPRGAVDALLAWRDGPDRTGGTEDDRIWSSLDELAAPGRRTSLNAEEAAVLAYLRANRRVAVHSDFFRVRARGWVEGGHGLCEIEAVLEAPERGPVRVVEWTERWLR